MRLILPAKQEGQYYELIDNIFCLVTDVGCPNFQQARENRARVALSNKTIDDYWRKVDYELCGIPWGAPIPASIPQGEEYHIVLPLSVVDKLYK